MGAGIIVSPFEPRWIEPAISLWARVDGVEVGRTDTPAGLRAFLERNPGLSYVARAGEPPSLLGVALCGHDGRRGTIHHLAVEPAQRRDGIARRLVEACLQGLRDQGIEKCHAFVFRDNPFAELFWDRTGWQRRHEVEMFSRFLEAGKEV